MIPTSPMVQNAWQHMTVDQQNIFRQEYARRARSTTAMVLLAILFPIQLILLNRVGLWVAFFLTSGGVFVWWIVEWFLTPGRVRTYNSQVERTILAEMGLSNLAGEPVRKHDQGPAENA